MSVVLTSLLTQGDVASESFPGNLLFYEPLLMSMHFPKSADLFFHGQQEEMHTLKYCRGVKIPKEGFIYNSMPLK